VNFFLEAIWAWKAARGKIRKEWELHGLSDEQLATVLSWLFDLTYKEAAAKCSEEFDRDPSETTLHEFYKALSPFILGARIQSAKRGADAIAQEEETSNLEPAIVRLIQQSAFELLSNPRPDTKAAKTFVTAVLKIREQKLSDRRIKVLEDNMEKARAKLKELREPGKATTEEERSKILEEVDRLMGVKR